ncbi:YfiT family bacillithiol transferase [Flectobacillus roseus]|uniref:Metal-dependent hydrolase n=1 Tax=Flectobacillus roseus TaxID=502259 RepID=A0ABT6Y2A6_9BACT|nr:putative metal-dependent hydrolase [Flectobacillus roseus]MDI9857700.1 putative metal-dependent hydrolase [Flectobacillus roseus]
MDITALQFPIGKWSPKGEYTPEEFQERLNTLKNIPAEYRALTENLSHEDLQKQYREGSWTIQQLINHVADMHLLHYIRFKHALTETDPNGVVAKIDAWATMEEAKTAPIAFSLQMIEGTHARWTYLIEQMSEEEFQRGYYHPIRQIYIKLIDALDMGAWHAKHHLEHIKLALGK